MKTFFALAAALLLFARSPQARGQACCAGSSAVTPGRLGLHDWLLVGGQAKAGFEVGSFDDRGRYQGQPAGAAEEDFEEDLFASVRAFKRGQLALLVPFVETWRRSSGISEFGGGIGDLNASARYDFTLAGASRWLPGIALLAGLTFPTGTPPDAKGLGPLATGATGIGAYQFNLGLALEQTFGPWLVNLTGLVADRTGRTVGTNADAIREHLAPQWTILAALAYGFDNDAAVALSASYAVEGDATINGDKAAASGRRTPTISVSGLWPFSDVFRGQLVLSDNPPVPGLGQNQTADIGITAVFVRTWF